MPSWKDLGSTLNTLREIDVNAIRQDSEHPVKIACAGPAVLVDELVALLRRNIGGRYGPAEDDPLLKLPLRGALRPDALQGSDLALLVVDGREPLPALSRDMIARFESAVPPLLAVILHGDQAPAGLTARHAVTIPEPDDPTAADQLAMALFEHLPAELHLAAARRLPGLRNIYARELVAAISFANSSYAFAAGLPEQIPILSVPFAAADIVVLTKNQALMVYKLALAHGAPPDFQARISEVLPVVGGAYAWRQLARTLIGLIPVWGLLPKVSIAYAGTYATGVAAWRWYSSGELISGEQLKHISAQAMEQGRVWAAQLLEQAREQGRHTPGRLRSAAEAFTRRLPFPRRDKPEGESRHKESDT